MTYEEMIRDMKDVADDTYEGIASAKRVAQWLEVLQRGVSSEERQEIADFARFSLSQPESHRAPVMRRMSQFVLDTLAQSPEATPPLTDNDKRWRFLEHGCQWVSFIPTNGGQHSFDPRVVSKAPGVGLLYMREVVDREIEKQLATLRDGISHMNSGEEPRR